jgi:hypothetical protein
MPQVRPNQASVEMKGLCFVSSMLLLLCPADAYMIGSSRARKSAVHKTSAMVTKKRLSGAPRFSSAVTAAWSLPEESSLLVDQDISCQQPRSWHCVDQYAKAAKYHDPRHQELALAAANQGKQVVAPVAGRQRQWLGKAACQMRQLGTAMVRRVSTARGRLSPAFGAVRRHLGTSAATCAVIMALSFMTPLVVQPAWAGDSKDTTAAIEKVRAELHNKVDELRNQLFYVRVLNYAVPVAFAGSFGYLRKIGSQMKCS